jgi:hypothetical protein
MKSRELVVQRHSHWKKKKTGKKDDKQAENMNTDEQKLHRAVRLNDPVATREILKSAVGKIDPNCVEQKVSVFSFFWSHW